MGNIKKVLVTGSSGFIGFHLTKRLIKEGFEVIGIDNMNPYYEVSLKDSRSAILNRLQGFHFHKIDLCDKTALDEVFKENDITHVVNLAAQAGVRYSLKNPQAYVKSNIEGFVNILECCRCFKVSHLVYASSSSVYGANTLQPFSVNHHIDHPVSMYGATKKSNELIAHTYAANFHLPVTGLRFFTVYGAWGRPDMALFLFTDAILDGRPIDVFNDGKMSRDFTYVDDVVEGIFRVLHIPAQPNLDWDASRPDPSTSFVPFRIFNIGSHRPSSLMRFIEIIEEKTGKKAVKRFKPMQPGDVVSTYADVDSLQRLTGYSPATPLEHGVELFVSWFRDYYKK